MSAILILSVLKFSGIVLAAISAAWGLTKKTTVDGEDGRKKLTAAGQVSLLIIIGSGIVSVGAFGFETVVKQNETDAAQRKQILLDASRAQQASLDLQRENLRRYEAADIRDRLTSQRILALTIAAQQKDLDLRNSEAISRGTRFNLNKTQQALVQIDRSLHPIGNMYLTLLWKLRGPAPVGPKLSDALHLSKVAYSICPDGSDLIRYQGKLYHEFNFEQCIRSLEEFQRVNVIVESSFPSIVIYAKDDTPDVLKDIAAGRHEEDKIYWFKGDIDFSFDTSPSEVFISQLDMDVYFTLDGIVLDKNIYRSGKIASVNDFDGSYILVSPIGPLKSINGSLDDVRSGRNRLEIEHLTLKVGGREISISGERFSRAWVGERPVFIAGPIDTLP